VKFSKYQGTGNDFIIIDDRKNEFPLTDTAFIARLCHRKFGIGADGLMLLQLTPGYDFKMVYYNSDGRESSMCGNGGRCLVRFARQIGLIQNHCSFMAIDGPHEAYAEEEVIKLKMQDVTQVEHGNGFYVLNTGSPHYVCAATPLSESDIVRAAREIRYNERFAAKGINVNFVEDRETGIYVRTYERGVEDETLSCGTGVTAAALTHALRKQLPYGKHRIHVETPGGRLEVSFCIDSHRLQFTDVWLTGPAEHVFTGEVKY
jgi:diaminopimelate epimerase